MHQILQNLANGQTELADIPCPQAKPGQLPIRTHHTLVSAGTERMLVAFGKANYLDKARQQPDKVRMVLDKIKTDELLPTVDTVRSKLDQPLPLGYCQAGTVLEVGAGVTGFTPGDRVVSNGKHAEVVCIPQNLCAKIPDNVPQLDNFRKLKGYGWPGFKRMNLWRQDKGQAACAAAFVEAVREGKPSPIPVEEIIEVSRVSIEIAQAQ